MLYFILEIKGKATKIISEIVKDNLCLMTHNGSRLDFYIVLNNLPQWRTVTNLIKKFAGNVLLKILKGCVDKKKLP